MDHVRATRLRPPEFTLLCPKKCRPIPPPDQDFCAQPSGEKIGLSFCTAQPWHVHGHQIVRFRKRRPQGPDLAIRRARHRETQHSRSDQRSAGRVIGGAEGARHLDPLICSFSDTYPLLVYCKLTCSVYQFNRRIPPALPVPVCVARAVLSAPSYVLYIMSTGTNDGSDNNDGGHNMAAKTPQRDGHNSAGLIG